MSTPAGGVPFALQRVVCFALLMGMAAFALVVAVLLQSNDGKGLATPRIEALDTAVIAGAATACALALGLRPLLHRAAERQVGGARSSARFRATLLPLAMLEGGCLLGLTGWLLNGNAVPNLVVALVVLSIAIAIVPFRDPDQDRAG